MRKLNPLFILLITFSQLSYAYNLDRVLNLRGDWKFSIGDDKLWANPTYDDSKWEKIWVPSSWEDEGFFGYDGFAWYRKTFDGAEIDENQEVYLDLGYIDDVDEVYINGRLVGFSGSFPPNFYTAYQSRRLYPIPSAYLNYKGENLIAIRIFDVTHHGGILSGKIGLYAQPEIIAEQHNLEGVWKFKLGNNKNWSEPYLDDLDWGKIMTPGNWKNLKIKHQHDSAIGWYRKSFKCDQVFSNKPSVLVLGKIDDFDKVYLNGTLIGETNDGRRFGHSDSWQELRIYKIPEGCMKHDRTNVLAVQVIDMGADAGIYQGPLALVTEDKLNQYLRNNYWLEEERFQFFKMDKW